MLGFAQSELYWEGSQYAKYCELKPLEEVYLFFFF